MVTFGLDISHHQDPRLDLAQARREGIEFIVLKATEGRSFVDREFAANLAEARAAGLLVAAYHFVRGDASASAQVANVRRVVPLDVPVIPDVEGQLSSVSLTREVVDELRAAGYRVPLLYLPRWYWQQLGSPSLAGLPPLWSSRYPDNLVGSLADEWADVPGHYWQGYGGLDVAVLQFTSSARIAGHHPIDANAYLGTRDQLAQLLDAREDSNMKNLIIARRVGGQDVWVGDGVTRRWIPNDQTLRDIQHWIARKGGDITVHDFKNIEVLGAPLEMRIGELSNDEASIVAAIRALPAPGDVDEEALAASLAPVLAPLIPGGATPEQVKAALKEVFASAGAETPA